MDRTIIVYSTSWCQPCKLAKKLLHERGLDYQEIDIEEKGGAGRTFSRSPEEEQFHKL